MRNIVFRIAFYAPLSNKCPVFVSHPFDFLQNNGYFRNTTQLCAQGTGNPKRVTTFSAAFLYQE